MTAHVIRKRDGRACASGNFGSHGEAQREADAWNGKGEFGWAPWSGWTAEVHEGPAPPAPCGEKFCARISPHHH